MTKNAAPTSHRDLVDVVRTGMGPVPSRKTVKVFAIGVALGVVVAYVVAASLKLDFGNRQAPATQERREALPSAGPTAAP
ncbi:MAG: hypothetical protein U0414_22710 [Polyangiaceae bacterium]